MRKKGRTLGERLSGVLELPVSVLEGLPEISLLGNREATVEHCQGVLQYNDRVVRLNTGKLTVKFTGSELRLNCMTGDSVVVSGRFASVEFSR